MPSLLAITDNQTLLVGLTLRGTWQVEVSEREIEGPPDALLVDDNGTDRVPVALALAEELGIGHVVVITEEDHVPGAVVVHRPYRFDDLLAALESSTNGDEGLTDHPTPPTPSVPKSVEVPAARAGQSEARESKVDVAPDAPPSDGLPATIPGPDEGLQEEETDRPSAPMASGTPTTGRKARGERRPRRRREAASKPPERTRAAPPVSRASARARPEDIQAPRPNIAAEVAEAGQAVGRVMRLLDRIPLLASLGEVAQALADEVRDITAGENSAVYRRDGDVYRVVASTGLSRAEQRNPIAVSHELVARVGRTGGLLLVEGAGQSLLAGWAGSRSPSYLVVPAGLGDPPPALVTVGGSDLDQDDLEAAAEAAAHASAGFELASALYELARRLARGTDA